MRPNRVPKKQGIFRRFFYWLMTAAFLIEVIYILFFSGFLSSANIEIRGTEEIDPQIVREIIDSQISGKYLNYIEKNNLLLLSSEKIKKMIYGEFRKIKEVKIQKDFKRNLFVDVIERKSRIILCSGEPCYVVDDEGIAFSEADLEIEKNKENKLLIFINESNRFFNLNDEVLASEFMNYLYDIKDKLKNDLDLEIEQEIRTPQIISGDIRVKITDGWMIYFNNEIPLEKEIEMLKVVLDEKIEKEKRGDLEYVDLRTNNKVFYKLKNSEQQSQDQKPVEEIKKDDKKSDKKKKTLLAFSASSEEIL